MSLSVLRTKRGRWLLAAMVVAVCVLVGMLVVDANDTGGEGRRPRQRVSAGPVVIDVPIPPRRNLPGRVSTYLVGGGCPTSNLGGPLSESLWRRVVLAPNTCGGTHLLREASNRGGVVFRWYAPATHNSHCILDVYVPQTQYADSERVAYAVSDDRSRAPTDGFVVAQARHRGEWVDVGTYSVGDRGGLWVRMSNKSNRPGHVVASAIRFTCQRDGPVP